MMSENDWIINIENAATEVERLIGRDAVKQIFRKYDATSTDDLNPLYFCDVFGELDYMVHDAAD